MKEETKQKIYFHGELCIIESDKKELSGKRLKLEEDLKVADSETTGNFHMLKNVEGLIAYEDKDADRFMVRSEKSDTKIYCKLKNRHTDLKLLKDKTYEIYPSIEVDHITDEIRNVRD